MSRPAGRELKPWFYWTLGIIGGVILVLFVVLAFVQPSQEILTGLATVLIPVLLLAIDATNRWFKKRRR